MIEGVEITPLKTIPDDRGMVKHFITRNKIPDFAECYITTVYDGIRKGWHGYPTKTIHYCVPQGMVKLALWDARQSSETYGETMTIFLGDVKYERVKIPPGVFNAFQGIAKPVSTIVVVANEIFSEDRIIRRDIDDSLIPYDWSFK